jgi:hypothetical protein
LFLSTQGLTKGSGMTVNGLKATVRRWGEKLGFRISPHDFCRTFALQTTKNKAPTRVVQVGGGWKGIDMVVHYTRGLELDAIRPYLPIKNLLGWAYYIAKIWCGLCLDKANLLWEGRVVELALFSLKSDSLERESIGSGFESRVGHTKKSFSLEKLFLFMLLKAWRVNLFAIQRNPAH